MAVNSYRFMALYLMIGLLVGTLTLINQDYTSTQKYYDLEIGNRVGELANTNEEIYESSETLVKADNLVLTTNYGDESAFGRNWVEVFRNGFLPYGIIPSSEIANASETEKQLNWLIILFRWFITLFAGYEAFQMIMRKST